MQEIESCDVCGHQQSVEKYADWKCEQCGSAYAYGDGFILQLTDEQKRLISKRGTCKECRHWARNRPNVKESMPRDLAYKCWAANEPEDVTEPSTEFWADDGPAVLTGPDFGCIHFAPKAIRGSLEAADISQEAMHSLGFSFAFPVSTPRAEIEARIADAIEKFYTGQISPPSAS